MLIFDGNEQAPFFTNQGLTFISRFAAFFAEMKRAREETVKFHSLAQFASIFLDSSVNSCMVSCVWCSRVSRISDGQLE